MELMKKISILSFLFIFFVVGLYYWTGSDNIKDDRSKADIGGQTFYLDIADNYDSLRQGLSGRESLPRNEAMLFIFLERGQPAFWMKGMKFALDLLWVDGDKIVDYEKNMPVVSNDYELRRYYPVLEADKAIELNAGTIDALGIQKGDIIKFDI